jgi:hypothetical protein
MDKSTILRAFNNHFFEFIDDIIGIIPENEDIQIARLHVQTMRKANPTLLIRFWNGQINARYGELIKKGDLEYFFNKDYGEDLGNVPDAKYVMHLINTVREPIRGMSEVNRGHSLTYLKNLCMLSEQYNECTKEKSFGVF